MEFSSTSRSGSSTRALKSSMDSKTTAVPRWRYSESAAALGFTIAPPGQRLPFSTQIPAVARTGSATVRITLRLKHSASAMTSRCVRPEAVRPSSASQGASSFIAAGTPPA
jgi:hypothetical protein